MHNALTRKCLEEIGEQVEIKEFLHIREYIGKNHEHSLFNFNVHQVEYYFVCNIINAQNNYGQTNPDSHQVDGFLLMKYLTLGYIRKS